HSSPPTTPSFAHLAPCSSWKAQLGALWSALAEKTEEPKNQRTEGKRLFAICFLWLFGSLVFGPWLVNSQPLSAEGPTRLDDWRRSQVVGLVQPSRPALHRMDLHQ